VQCFADCMELLERWPLKYYLPLDSGYRTARMAARDSVYRSPQ
jgi:hypothetical protein